MGLFCVGGRDLEACWTLAESHSHFSSYYTSGAGLQSRGNRGGHSHTKVTYEVRFQKSRWLFVPCVAFPGPGNIYKLNYAPIACWSMQARHWPSKAAVAHLEVLVAVFVHICIVAVKLQWPLL